MNRGFGDAMSRAFEVAVTPVLFGLGGHLLDGRFGTRPLFTLALALFAVAGVFVRLWLEYDREMRRHEETLARSGRSPRLRPTGEVPPASARASYTRSAVTDGLAPGEAS